MAVEFDVYSRLIDFLRKKGWQIVCASPPGGTDNRYSKCLLPRRQLHGSEKGPRDEMDMAAHDGKALLLAECKPRLSDSLRCSAKLGESDYMKLKRIGKSFSPSRLAQLLSRRSSTAIPSDLSIALVLAVGIVNCKPPLDITVLEFSSNRLTLAVGPAAQNFVN